MQVLRHQGALDYLVEFLAENPDQMYVSEKGTSALVYYPPDDRVIFVVGDFSGNAEECNRELQRRLQELE
jgi:tRNA pseudouridine-54 N-methylase